MTSVVVLGAGPIGSTTAAYFADRGDRVRLVSRSGRAPTHPGTAPRGGDVEPVALDVSDAAALRDLTAGADVIVNAINLPYHRWATDWPPIHRAIRAAAEHSGAVLALAGSFYAYPAGANPMTPTSPLAPPSRKGAIRARMWEDLLAAHTAGHLRAVEVRASDYLGPQVTSPLGAHAGPRLIDPVLAGRRAWVVGDPDAQHTWTAVDDIARAIVTTATDERAWGRAWHVPSAPPRSFRQLAEDIADVAGAPPARVARIPRIALRAVGLFQPQLREVVEMLYQFDDPFIASHEETTQVFGLEPMPWHETIMGVISARRELLAA